MDNQLIDEFKSAKDLSKKQLKQVWARLIQKVYEVDPMRCPEYRSKMKAISVIMDQDEIKEIMTYLNKKNKSPPVLENAS